MGKPRKRWLDVLVEEEKWVSRDGSKWQNIEESEGVLLEQTRVLQGLKYRGFIYVDVIE